TKEPEPLSLVEQSVSSGVNLIAGPVAMSWIDGSPLHRYEPAYGTWHAPDPFTPVDTPAMVANLNSRGSHTHAQSFNPMMTSTWLGSCVPTSQVSVTVYLCSPTNPGSWDVVTTTCALSCGQGV